MANEAKFKQHLVELQSQKATLREIFGTGEGDNDLFEDMFLAYLNSVKWLESKGQTLFNEVTDTDMIQRILEEVQAGSKLKNEFQLEFKRGRSTLKQFVKSMIKTFDDIENSLRNQSSANAGSNAAQRLNAQNSGGSRQAGGPSFGGSGIMIGSNSNPSPGNPNITQQEPSQTPTLGLNSQQRGGNSYEYSAVPIDGFFNPNQQANGSRVQDSNSQSQSAMPASRPKYQAAQLLPEPEDNQTPNPAGSGRPSAFNSLPHPTQAVSQPYPSSRQPAQSTAYTSSLAMPASTNHLGQSRPQTQQPPNTQSAASAAFAGQGDIGYTRNYNPNPSKSSIRDIIAEAEQEILKRMKDSQERLSTVRKETFATEHLESQLREQLRRVKEENVKQELTNKRNEMICSELRPQREQLQLEVEELIDANERLESQLNQKLKSQQDGILKQIKSLQAEKAEISKVTGMLDEENRRVLDQIESLKSYIKMDTLGQGQPVFTPLFYAQPEDTRYDEKSLELMRLREGINSTVLGNTRGVLSSSDASKPDISGPLGDMYGYSHNNRSRQQHQNSFSAVDLLEGRPSAPVTSLQGKHFSSKFLRS